jgi:hypothetical protein
MKIVSTDTSNTALDGVQDCRLYLTRHRTRQRQMFAVMSVLLGCALPQAGAAIAVGSGIPLTFDTLPPASEWATLAYGSGAGTIEGDAEMDAAMISINASSITATLGTKSGSGTSGTAYWRSGDKKLGTQPTSNAMTLLLATLQNTSGGTVDGLLISYQLGMPTVAPGEQTNGHRVYWSKSGAIGTWNVLGDYLLSVTGGTKTVNIPLTSLAWANGDMLYVVWADDNGLTNPDGDYTLDDVSFTPFNGPLAAISSPAHNATVGSDFMIEAIAANSNGTISQVAFYDGATLLGTDTTSPYSYEWRNAPLNGHSLTVQATAGTGGVSTASPVVNVTVVAGSGVLQRGPYLQKAAPTQTTICWRSTLSTLGQVRYGTNYTNLNQVANEPAISASPLNHVVPLTGLTPNTTYYYSIGTAADTLASGADYTFTTPPLPGTVMNTRIWALGDEGTGNADQTAVRDAFYSWTGARVPNLVLQLGDNAYEYGSDANFQAGMFNIYPTLLRKTPFWSCLGNHETNQGTAFTNAYPYFDIYTLPTAGECGGVASGTEHYFAFDYANIHFISLDSMTASRSPTGAMATWLRADLASTTATWIIAFFHHPPYTKGSHDSDTEAELIAMRQNILPILEAGGVDLVLCGHSHSYERSYLLDGHYGLSGTLTPAMKKNAGNGRPAGNGAYIKPLTGPRDHFGAVYAVSGSAGKISGGALNHAAHCISLNNLGSFVLDINGARLDATFLREINTTPDTFTIIKQGAADSDGDGIPDEYELAHGLNRFNATDAALDSDGDGVSNRNEFILATESNNSDRFAFSTSYDTLAGTATVSFPTIAGRTYRVLYSANLLTWEPASASLTGTGTTQTWTDSPPVGTPQRFYRVEVTVVP